MEELDFSPTHSRVQIDLRLVRQYCKPVEAINLHGASIPGKGWITPVIWSADATLEEQVRIAVEAGANYFTFHIKQLDRWDRVQNRYPDFGLREITIQNQ